MLLGSCATTTKRYEMPEALIRPDEKLLLKNVSIVDVRTGSLARETRVLLNKGKIAGLFTDAQWPEATADREIDLQGAFVMPGLINAHCHMTAPSGIAVGPSALLTYKRQVERNAEECVKHGVTTVRDMLSVADWIAGVEWLKERITRGKIAGPRILRSSAIDINNGYGDWLTNFSIYDSWYNVGSEKEARKAVRSAAAHGADLIKLFQQKGKLVMPCDDMPLMDQKTVDIICNEAARHNLPVAMHHMELAGMEKGVAGGVTSLEHVVCDEAIPDETIQAFLDNQTFIVPTVTVPYGYTYPMNGDENWGTENTAYFESLRAETLPGLLDEFCEPTFAKGSMGFYKKFSDPRSYEKRHIIPWLCPKMFNAWANQGVVNVMALYEAGVQFGCGNDGGVPFVFPGGIGFEMWLLEELGMKTADVLKMATLNNARLIGMENELGTVEKFKLADLAVYKNNPLLTAKNTLKPAMVFQGGRLVFQA